ncbi:hypothetical protein SERLADRAFT_434536 [Serpula lacrymans var. lacrymans S7.9]|uniref:Uncharacterized protein n=1 Tax=Serpula lacrymans var. lacrymans (strain S7.9) TaxID=578457 RepID=F8NLR6_SERL9|nr:uncharacterized protein SERLADRAFT_434536 [Serpula lacrymans var. lacrymans S7.9]EGO28618.1 hypothetical protein SERLADRAFT_434536 [Serpula lacrymans var. lacrymans S7.9]
MDIILGGQYMHFVMCKAFLKMPLKEWHQMNLTTAYLQRTGRSNIYSRAEQHIFKELLKLVPSLERHLMGPETTEEDIIMVADMIQKGANGARSDNTKSLKSAVIDWITPRGQTLSPHIYCNVKAN